MVKAETGEIFNALSVTFDESVGSSARASGPGIDTASVVKQGDFVSSSPNGIGAASTEHHLSLRCFN